MRISDWSADVCSSDLTQEAAARREALRAAIQASDHVYNCHGVEMNQRYASGAVVDDGSPEPAWLRDPELYHQASSRPGAHLPHVWLSENGRRVAAMDLVGNGRITDRKSTRLNSSH